MTEVKQRVRKKEETDIKILTLRNVCMFCTSFVITCMSSYLIVL